MKCPECGKEYSSRPAVSRVDNETLICPQCGIRQALSAVGVDPAEIEKVIAIVMKYAREEKDK